MFHVDEVWMQRGLDALEEMFRVDDATKRDMIEFLFNEGFWNKEQLKWEAAVARFNDCLNPNKPKFFKLAELWALMKAFRRHGLLHAMGEDLGYQPLRVAPTEARRQELLERIAVAHECLLAEYQRARAELPELTPTTAPVRIHPAFHEGHGGFSRAPQDATSLTDEQDAGQPSGGF